MGAALNNLAWIYATDPRSELRDADEAVRLAEQACQLSDRTVPSRLTTLAAAYAAAGRFDKAVATAEEAMRLAAEHGQQGDVAKIQAHLELYQQQQAYRPTAGVPATGEVNGAIIDLAILFFCPIFYCLPSFCPTSFCPPADRNC